MEVVSLWLQSCTGSFVSRESRSYICPCTTFYSSIPDAVRVVDSPPLSTISETMTPVSTSSVTAMLVLRNSACGSLRWLANHAELILPTRRWQTSRTEYDNRLTDIGRRIPESTATAQRARSEAKNFDVCFSFCTCSSADLECSSPSRCRNSSTQGACASSGTRSATCRRS